MKYLLLFNLTVPLWFFSAKLIFLNHSFAQESYANEFNLNKRDLRLIEYYFSIQENANSFDKLPKVTSSSRVNTFFKILKNTDHPKWIPAYLLLLEIIPSLITEDIGC
jgi:hypothetical protein